MFNTPYNRIIQEKVHAINERYARTHRVNHGEGMVGAGRAGAFENVNYSLGYKPKQHLPMYESESDEEEGAGYTAGKKPRTRRGKGLPGGLGKKVLKTGIEPGVSPFWGDGYTGAGYTGASKAYPKYHQGMMPEYPKLGRNLQGEGIVDKLIDLFAKTKFSKRLEKKVMSGTKAGFKNMYDRQMHGRGLLGDIGKKALTASVPIAKSLLKKGIRKGADKLESLIGSGGDGIGWGAGKKGKKSKTPKKVATGQKLSREQRGAMIKKLMKEHNCSLPEASKMLKQHMTGGNISLLF